MIPMSSPMQIPRTMLCIDCVNTIPQRNAMETGKTFSFITIHLTFLEPAYSKYTSDDCKNRAEDSY